MVSLCLQVCLAAVGIVGDLCRALGSNILPHCDELMMMLLENLGVSVCLWVAASCTPLFVYIYLFVLGLLTITIH